MTGAHTTNLENSIRVQAKYNLELDLKESNRITRAGDWLLESGIQEISGGVSRYRRTDLGVNLPISTEITGYALSGLCLAFEESGASRFLEAAKRAADFLIAEAWQDELKTMPFELGSTGRYSYFFDCGIIARGLLWLYRITQSEIYLNYAQQTGVAMERDFRALSGFHPIVLLPCKSPAPYEIWWSRMPGAFQLKAALAWLDLSLETGDAAFRDSYEKMLSFSLRRYRETLDNEVDETKKMDRLHAWAYFLEGLRPVIDRKEVAETFSSALAEAESLRDRIAPQFLRSDVCAQLLRLRLLSGGQPAATEVERIENFQYASNDKHLDGGFAFGSRYGELTPHVNPVSTVFSMQALSYARRATEGSLDHADWRRLI